MNFYGRRRRVDNALILVLIFFFNYVHIFIRIISFLGYVFAYGLGYVLNF